MKIIGTNKRAGFDYSLKEFFEAGIVLQGTEVKVLREGKVNLGEAYVVIDGEGEVWAYNVLIPQYAFGNIHNHQEARVKKLLLNRLEINRIYHTMKTQQMSLVVTKIYFKDSKVKLEFALAKGKKLHDKRESDKEKDVKRKLQRGSYDE
ncbi:SsrA-binding protein SmpB [Bacteriovorax stolpii]|uniref:SsrA-binding protein n=1 Tax=Bacteriovorax stolpii TaxID=960 RepID=A0A2K9NRA9_BACTC|nr:SsrA-binding protein SmpB [Bacteriovorax stolpii]AUN97284.1 SsrA-binding protein [Bacteriovorax stolpii]QDK42778.1 SsrA-binding protein SmpB [Bacteriovorax stolpii]TDP52455.1 SsrA-binding protein [Bacteriovorax stolpii]BDT27370.1 SsrA-binding protein SmpB [Bacteriovorax sp. HI3]